MGRYLVLAMLVAATLGTASLAVADGVEQRLERIERLLGSDALLGMDRAQRQLQSEFAALRNDLDLLTRQVRELQQQQRSLYQELDDRSRALERSLGRGTDGLDPVDDLPVDDLSFVDIAEETDADDAASVVDEVALAQEPAPDAWVDEALDADSIDPLQALIDERMRLQDPGAGEAAVPPPEPLAVPATPPSRWGDTDQLPDSPPPALTISGDDPSATPEELASEYERAFALLQEGHYERAANGFQRIIRQHPTSPIAENARFWLAESYYIIREFDAAEEQFLIVAEVASAARQAEALLKLGFIHYERGQWQGARTYLRRVVDQHPETTSALLARDRLAELQAAGR